MDLEETSRQKERRQTTARKDRVRGQMKRRRRSLGASVRRKEIASQRPSFSKPQRHDAPTSRKRKHRREGTEMQDLNQTNEKARAQEDEKLESIGAGSNTDSSIETEKTGTEKTKQRKGTVF